MAVKVEINAPDNVLLTKDTKTVQLDVGVTLRNLAEQDFVATVSNSNDVIFWHLLDSNQREVARMPQSGKPLVSKEGHTVMEKRVPGGTIVTFPETIEVDAKKLKHGGTYFLRVRTWGKTGEHELHVCALEQAPTATTEPTPDPAGAAKKKAGAKKPAAKKPAASKTAAKKPAAKKGKKAA